VPSPSYKESWEIKGAEFFLCTRAILPDSKRPQVWAENKLYMPTTGLFL
jgi:hypothetical protein